MINQQTKRIKSIDLARGIGVFFIPMAHTLLIYGTPYLQEESLFGIIVHFFGKWAGIFIIAMGFSYILSKRNTVITSLKRGVLLLFAGYFMNFLKFVIPTLMGILPESFFNAYGWNSPINFNQMLYMTLTGDILQFAGMCLLFMGIIHKYAQQHKYLVLIIAAIILVSTEFIRGVHLGVPGVDYVLDLLWGKDWNVYFPVFPWFVFVLVGMFFGYVFKENNRNIEKTYQGMLYYGIITLIIGCLLCFYDYEFHMKDYFHTGIGGVLYLLGFNLLFFYSAQKVMHKIEHYKITQIFLYCSNKITSLYVVQWVLISWGMAFFGYHDKSGTSIAFLMVLFTLLTFIVQITLDKMQSYKTRYYLSQQDIS